jgi:crotonobetainyl-CoA:carnitine CoA-transferase CaiB-like acyl-CoA transferase
MGLLDEVKVLDLSTYVMGPFAAMMLADMGADVIKVEPPRGDPNRRVGRQSGGTGVLFASTNHGKRSIVLDLKDPGDAAVARGLVRWADVLLENWRPGVAERLGLDPATLESLNPRLTHVNLTGWGPGGPWRDRPAFDGLLQAFSGVAWSASTAGEPALVRFYVGDKVAGMFAAQAVLGGLLAVARTGKGQRLQVNMVDANAYFNFPDTFTTRFLLDDDGPVNPEQATMTNTLVRARDGHLVVQPASGRQIRSICEALNHPEWLAEFKAAPTNEELTPLLGARVESVTITGPVAHWVELFAEHDVPAAPVLDLDGHLAHPQVVANETYGHSEHPGFGTHRVARYPAREVESDDGARAIGTFPDLDEHAAEIRALAARYQTPGG